LLLLRHIAHHAQLICPICAELTGSDTCAALDIVAHGNAPVLDLCRKLVEAGHDPDLPLEAFRDKTLCLPTP
jgi:hypothetical protein